MHVTSLETRPRRGASLRSGLEVSSEFYHGVLKPCHTPFIQRCYNRDDVQTHFAAIRRKAQDNSQNLSLLWIDLKLTASGMTDFFSSGQKLAESMIRPGSLFPPCKEVPINVLLEAKYVNFFAGFREHIMNERPNYF